MNLYVFVDESGNHSQGDYYTLAGIWCPSHRSSASRVLEPTGDRLLEQANRASDGKSFSELKGARLRPDLLNRLIANIERYGYDDKTVSHSPSPWANQQPFRCTLHDAHPKLAKSIISDVIGDELNAPEVLQTLSLATILDPAFDTERIDMSQINTVEIVLDATTWERSKQRMEHGLEVLDSQSSSVNFEFSIVDSKSTPGVQIADLIAYSWARYQREGDCKEAVRTIHSMRFSDT